MLKKTITYTDYNGVDRTETFYFNLNETELLEMEVGVNGGFAEMLQKMVQESNIKEMISVMKKLILKAYGVKSEDGKRFIKSEALSDEFSQTEAFNTLFTELLTDKDAATSFFNGVIPLKGIKRPPVTKAVDTDALSDRTTG